MPREERAEQPTMTSLLCKATAWGAATLGCMYAYYVANNIENENVRHPVAGAWALCVIHLARQTVNKLGEILDVTEHEHAENQRGGDDTVTPTLDNTNNQPTFGDGAARWV